MALDCCPTIPDDAEATAHIMGPRETREGGSGRRWSPRLHGKSCQVSPGPCVCKMRPSRVILTDTPPLVGHEPQSRRKKQRHTGGEAPFVAIRTRTTWDAPHGTIYAVGRVVSTGSAPSLGLEVGSELLDRLKPVTKIQTRKPGHECGPIRPTTSTSYNFEHAVGYGQTALPLVETPSAVEAADIALTGQPNLRYLASVQTSPHLKASGTSSFSSVSLCPVEPHKLQFVYVHRLCW
ncbi:hypothetical protein HDK90DRAFT_108121 [Phyllosticta capitalensis]|uniref:Uncharacterized protein n=1 Tax=Phyllosticta capitalensis TaxID=121624 RepID=A0ABR1YBI0_9PEZI